MDLIVTYPRGVVVLRPVSPAGRSWLAATFSPHAFEGGSVVLGQYGPSAAAADVEGLLARSGLAAE